MRRREAARGRPHPAAGRPRRAHRQPAATVGHLCARASLAPNAIVADEERATARELLAVAQVYFDKVMWPYYRHSAPNFLAWMQRAAQ